MLEKAKLTDRQLALLLTMTVVLATAVLFAPVITAASAGRDGWISVLVFPTIYGLLVAYIATKLGRRFPDKTIIEYAPSIVGVFFGKVVGILYVLFFIHVNSVIVREFGDFLLTAFMPETPLVVFIIVLLLLGAWFVKSGIEVISRANELIFVVFITSLIAIFIFVFHEADFTNLLPIMENGIRPVIKGALTPCAWRGEIFIILMLFPYLNNPYKTPGYLYSAVIIMGVILTFATVATTVVLGDLAPYFNFPFFSLARCISILQIFERMEALILVMWVGGVTIKVATFYYVSALGTAQLLGLKSFRPVVLPLGILMAALAMAVFDNLGDEMKWFSSTFPYYAFSVEIIIPTFLLIIAVVRKKGRKLRDVDL